MTDTLEGSTVSYTCDVGFKPIGSQMTRRCVLVTDQSGNRVAMWTGVVPNCTCKLFG